MLRVPQNVEGRRRKGSWFSGTSYVEFLDPEPKSARIESKNASGTSLTLDLPAGLFEDLEDMVPLYFRKRFER